MAREKGGSEKKSNTATRNFRENSVHDMVGGRIVHLEGDDKIWSRATKETPCPPKEKRCLITVEGNESVTKIRCISKSKQTDTSKTKGLNRYFISMRKVP